MKTLSITEARANLSAVLEQVRQGQDIGIISGNQIIQLKPVEIVPWEESYVFQEYGVTPEEWQKFRGQISAERKNQRYAAFKGKFDPKVLG